MKLITIILVTVKWIGGDCDTTYLYFVSWFCQAKLWSRQGIGWKNRGERCGGVWDVSCVCSVFFFIPLDDSKDLSINWRCIQIYLWIYKVLSILFWLLNFLEWFQRWRWDVRWVGPSRPPTKHWADIFWPVAFCSKTPKQMGGFTWTLKTSAVTQNMTPVLLIQEIPTQRDPAKDIGIPHQK